MCLSVCKNNKQWPEEYLEKQLILESRLNPVRSDDFMWPLGRVDAHLDADSLDDAGNNVENLHFGVAFIDLLQQLEQQAEYRLQVLKRNKRVANEDL